MTNTQSDDHGDAGKPPPQSLWETPTRYGYTAAIDGMGSISAPLLAAVSITLAGVLLTSPASFPHLHVALLALVIATFALVAAVQWTFHARQFVVTPGELLAWWPDDQSVIDALRTVQKRHSRAFYRHANIARWAYNIGLLAFGAGVVAMLAPPTLTHQSLGTVAPSGAAALCELAELIWILGGATASTIKRQLRRR